MIQQLKVKCATSTPRYTTRDALISAAVLLGATLVMSMAGIWASRSGHKDLGEFLTSLAFPASILISMPFAITKGQSRTSQTFFIAVPMAILVVLSYIAVKL
jgi:4-hydroxybenzoate polyprenyltransferase